MLSQAVSTFDKKYAAIASITDWRVVTPLEYKLKAMAEQAVAINQKLNANPATDLSSAQSEICAICQEDLLCPEFAKLSISEAIARQAAMQAVMENKRFDETFTSVVMMPSCIGCHAFHRECIFNHFSSMKKDNDQVKFYQCIVCKVSNGNRTGNMPPGTMKWSRERYTNLAGTDCYEGALVIDYRFAGGMIPGENRPYRADGRTAYLPYNDKGKQALGMLIEAFKRRLTFAIGTSQTTGEKDVIVWQGIHHKTSLKGGEHGYPDPKYLDNLWKELADRGITPDKVPPCNQDSGFLEIKDDKYKASQQKSRWSIF